MRKGCLWIFVALIALWIIGAIIGGDGDSPSTQTAKVSYTCVWCKQIFVGNEGELSCYYYDESHRGCGYHTVSQNTFTGFCTSNHCDLYTAANK